MRQIALEEVKAPRVANTTRLWVRLSLLSAFSAANIFVLLLIVPKFQEIFSDALGPDHPLPAITNFIIAGRIVFAVVTACWPILGTMLVRQQRPHSMLYLNIGIVWMFLQCGMTVIALFMPLCGGVVIGLGEGK
jgi:hypothetical protein